MSMTTTTVEVSAAIEATMTPEASTAVKSTTTLHGSTTTEAPAAVEALTPKASCQRFTAHCGGTKD